MALIDRAFDVLNGISLGDKVGIFYSDTSPNTSGLDSPKGSVALQVPPSGEPQLWKKFSSGSLEWKKLQTKTHTSTGIPDVTNDDVDTAGVGITFEPGDLWVNTTTSTGFYICFSNTTGAAVWRQPSSSVSFEASTANIKMDGTVSVGALDTVPRADHVHPSDTSKQNAHAIGNLTTSTGLLVSGGTGAVIGSGVVLSLPQALGINDSPTFVDVTLSSLHRTVGTLGTDTKMATGVPFSERGKFKVDFTYSAPNIVATISFVGANTSFSYYINGKKFTVTSTGLSAYTKSTTAAEGTWYFYINQTTTLVNSPDLTLSQIAWTIYDPDVLLWNAYFNATANTITWVGEERHTAGRDIYNHARNHAQGALYKSGLLFSQYNGLTAFSSNTNNNFGRAQAIVSSGSFYDEDIQNTISHTDASITSTTASPATDWNLTVSQFLGFTALATTGTNATTIVFPTTRTLVTDQAVTVMTGNTTTIRGTTTITTGGTGTSFTVSSVAGLASGDAIVIAARIPIYYISAVAGGVYTWRKITSTDFLGVSGGVGITAATIASATCQYNNTTAGGFATITANRYYPIYLIATNMTSEPVIAVLGQGQSTNSILATALGEASFQFVNLVGLSGLGIQEAVPFYRLTYHYNTGGAFSATHIKVVDVTFLNLRVATVSGTVIGASPSTMAASQVTTDTTNFSNILTTSETTVQSALDKIDDFQNTYATVANAEAATGVDNKLCYVVETETWYRYEATGSAYTDDNKWVLSTGDGGDTCWIGVAGKYNYTTTNVFEGTGALDIINSGTDNIAIGYRASHLTSTGNYVIAIGTDALYNSTASGNLAIGYKAGESVVSNSGNLYIGYTAGRYSTGTNETFIGYEAGKGVSGQSAGNNNVGIGYHALFSFTSGSNNVAVGVSAANNQITASNNTNIGTNAGYYGTGGYNTFLGCNAFVGVTGQTSGTDNVALGYSSALAATTASYNVIIGSNANASTTTGAGNTSIGYFAAASNTIGSYNVSIGFQAALALQTSTDTIIIGRYAGGKSFGSETGGIYIGYSCGAGCAGNSQNVLIGYNVLNTGTTNSSVVIGYEACKGSQGTSEVTNITVNSATIANYVGDYYRFYSNFGGSFTFDFWFDTTGSDSQPAGANGTVQTKITITGLTTVNQIATAIAVAMNGVTYRGLQIFSSSSTASPAIITVVNKGSAPDPVMTNASELSATVTTQGVDPSSGALNVFIGSAAGYAVSTGGNNVGIGYRALYAMTTGLYNVVVGAQAGAAITTGSENIAIGYQSLYTLTTTTQSIAIGTQAGYNATGSNGLIAIGYQAAYSTSGGGQSNIIAIGEGANSKTISASGNTIYMGTNSGLWNGNGVSCIGIGYEVMKNYYNASNNTVIGYRAGAGILGVGEITQITVNGATLSNYVGDWFRLYTGFGSTFDFWFDTTGSDSQPAGANGTVQTKITITGLTTTSQIASAINTAIHQKTYRSVISFTSSVNTNVVTATCTIPGVTTDGDFTQASELSGAVTTAGTANSSGAGNVFIGFYAGYQITTANYNVAIGYEALKGGASAAGGSNIAIGYQSFYAHTSAQNSIGIGYRALYSVTSGLYSVCIGTNAGYSISTSGSMVSVGYNAGRYSTGPSNTFFGYTAGQGAAAGASGASNTFVGSGAGQNFTTAAQSVFVGVGAGSNITTGSSNILLGAAAGQGFVTGSNNICIGDYTSYGYPSYPNGADQNIMIGSLAGYMALAGQNIFIGRECGYNAGWYSSNIFMGQYAGRNVITGNNVAIGYKTAGGSATGVLHEYSRAIAVADVSGSLAGKYFSLSSTTTTYWLWYKVSGTGTAPTPGAGETLVQVSITTNDTAIVVASTTVSAIAAISGSPFTSYSWSTALYAICRLAGGTTDISDGIGGLGTGFTCSVITQGSGTSTTATEITTLGHQALTALTAGSYNTALGFRAGYTLTTGTNNIFVGHTADTTSPGLVNSIVIGYGATTATSNQIYIGNASTTTAIVKGIYGTTDGSNSYVRVGSDGKLYQDNNPPASVTFETSTGNIKQDGVVSVGVLSTVPRADHVHPSSGSSTIVMCTANTGTAYTIDLANGTCFNLTLNDNVTFTFPATGTAAVMKEFWIYLNRDATASRTVTWDTDVKWPMDVVPALDGTASKLTIFHFTQLGNAARWYGEVLGMGYAI